MSWEIRQLGEFLTLKRGYDLPSVQRKEGDIPIVSSSGITGRHNVAKVEGPGVVTGRYGTLGEVFFVNEDYWPLNTALYVQDFKGNNPRFTAYFLKSVLTGTSSDKAAVPGVNRNDLHARKVRITRDVGQQTAIASILSTYDDLIENNRRRIQLLEQAARLLYKEWFVHFRFPGHDRSAGKPIGTAESRPAGVSAKDGANQHVKIKDGVPEGWEEGVVSDFYSTASGGTPSRKIPDFFTGDIPWVKTQELTGGFILSTDERITEEAIKSSSAKLFPRHAVIVAMYGATIGQIAILAVPSTTNQACCAVIPLAPGTAYEHAYLFFRHHKSDLVGLGQGAAQNNISQQVIKNFKMALPAKGLLDAFSESVCPYFDQIETLQKMNIRLTKARDLLLPRLMNGEIAV